MIRLIPTFKTKRVYRCDPAFDGYDQKMYDGYNKIAFFEVKSLEWCGWSLGYNLASYGY